MLYLIIPVERFIRELDGVFSFIIYDSLKEVFIIGHDPLGVRQLYWFFNEETNELGISSEMKCLYNLNQNIKFYPPGSYTFYFLKTKKIHTYSYYTFDYPSIIGIIIKEKEPIAILENENKYFYLDDKGSIIEELANIENIASMAPAAPKRCPVIDLVELTIKF